MKYLPSIVIGVVAIVIVAGFVIVGSPSNSRAARFDDRRVQDLSNLQWQIVNYWQRKEMIPETLSALRDDLSGFSIPVDPRTEDPYRYEKTGDHSFRLCATFEREVSESSVLYDRYAPIGGKGIESSWDHGVGEACFDRTIDPELYPPLPKGTQ